ncbi:MAG: DUF935 family protein [Fimbriimonadaceae bacterium]|nr:DUF935 family protein [Fimbriimonadaceae bacterium]QYK55469.1 MAG: DUF935 family protein [Fimbriimonadaceae bacterium]
MLKLFKKQKPPVERETAPQLTLWERQALATPGATLGKLPYATYDEMLKDSMVQTVTTLKKLSVLAAGWKLEPTDDSPAARERADFVTCAFDRMEGSPASILHSAMDAFVKGWSVQELVFRRESGQVWLEAVRAKDPSLFGFEVDAFGRMSGLTLAVPGEPARSLPRGKFVVYVHRQDYARPQGRSDLDAAYRHWQAKAGLLAGWRIHLEKFAMPTVTGRYERGLPVDEQNAILRALQDIQNSTAVVFPNEIQVGLLGGGSSAANGFLEAIEFHNREIARAVLGQTLTTDEGRRVGSLALGKVHLQILLLQIGAVRRELADSVMTEQVVRPLVELNFGKGLVPKFRFEENVLSAFSTGEV